MLAPGLNANVEACMSLHTYISIDNGGVKQTFLVKFHTGHEPFNDNLGYQVSIKFKWPYVIPLMTIGANYINIL